jgi:hypothetical protein
MNFRLKTVDGRQSIHYYTSLIKNKETYIQGKKPSGLKTKENRK